MGQVIFQLGIITHCLGWTTKQKKKKRKPTKSYAWQPTYTRYLTRSLIHSRVLLSNKAFTRSFASSKREKKQSDTYIYICAVLRLENRSTSLLLSFLVRVQWTKYKKQCLTYTCVSNRYEECFGSMAMLLKTRPLHKTWCTHSF
jgi:hypothetical protein